jgi:hypothetical protein
MFPVDRDARLSDIGWFNVQKRTAATTVQTHFLYFVVHGFSGSYLESFYESPGRLLSPGRPHLGIPVPTWPRLKTWRLSGFSPRAWDLTMGLLTQKRATIFHPPISFLCLSNIIIFYNFVNKDIKLGLSQKSQAAGEASQACRRNSRCLALWSGDLANYC